MGEDNDAIEDDQCANIYKSQAQLEAQRKDSRLPVSAKEPCRKQFYETKSLLY